MQFIPFLIPSLCSCADEAVETFVKSGNRVYIHVRPFVSFVGLPFVLFFAVFVAVPALGCVV